MTADQRILVVDNDPDFAAIARAVLHSHGYTVDSAHDGDRALELISANTPDLVLIDVMTAWPLEGVSMGQALMDGDVLRRVPVIMITSIRSTDYRHVFPQDRNPHGDAWLQKPCSPEELISEVESLIGGPEKSQETA